MKARSLRYPLLRQTTVWHATVWQSAVCLSVVLPLVFSGCVRRTMRITTEPTGALVYLNDREAGRSTLTVDFLWYGDYDVIIRKEGYQTLKTHWNVKPPWYETMPFDFVTEVLWPGHIHDRHERHFTLSEAVIPTEEELIQRATEMRARAFSRSP